jgi:hypothetical protein
VLIQYWSVPAIYCWRLSKEKSPKSPISVRPAECPAAVIPALLILVAVIILFYRLGFEQFTHRNFNPAGPLFVSS